MDKIFDEYYDKLYYWALKKTNNMCDAEDLVNDVFVIIFSYINKNIDINKIENLIWKVAHNIWYKKVKSYENEKGNVGIDEYSVGFTENNIDKIIYNEIVDNLDIFNLTENELKCFKLYYYKDLSISEISSIMNTSDSNIKYYLYSARNKIKERYYE